MSKTQIPSATIAPSKELEEWIPAGAERVLRLDPFQADLPDGPFDCILCPDLGALVDPWRVLAQIRGRLAEEGRFLACVPNARHHAVVTGLLNGWWGENPHWRRHGKPLRFFTRREMEKAFDRAGLRIARLGAMPHGEGSDQAKGGLRGGGTPRFDHGDAGMAEELRARQWRVEAVARPIEDFGLTSIVILTHNQIDYTRMCVDSILQLTDEPIELIFVDRPSSPRRGRSPSSFDSPPGPSRYKSKLACSKDASRPSQGSFSARGNVSKRPRGDGRTTSTPNKPCADSSSSTWIRLKPSSRFKSYFTSSRVIRPCSITSGSHACVSGTTLGPWTRSKSRFDCAPAFRGAKLNWLARERLWPLRFTKRRLQNHRLHQAIAKAALGQVRSGRLQMLRASQAAAIATVAANPANAGRGRPGKVFPMAPAVQVRRRVLETNAKHKKTFRWF